MTGRRSSDASSEMSLVLTGDGFAFTSRYNILGGRRLVTSDVEMLCGERGGLRGEVVSLASTSIGSLQATVCNAATSSSSPHLAICESCFHFRRYGLESSLCPDDYCHDKNIYIPLYLRDSYTWYGLIKQKDQFRLPRRKKCPIWHISGHNVHIILEFLLRLELTMSKAEFIHNRTLTM